MIHWLSENEFRVVRVLERGDQGDGLEQMVWFDISFDRLCAGIPLSPVELCVTRYNLPGPGWGWFGRCGGDYFALVFHETTGQLEISCIPDRLVTMRICELFEAHFGEEASWVRSRDVIDINFALRAALRSSSWGEESVAQLTTELATVNSGIEIEWERGDEDWCCLRVEGVTEAYICVCAPLILSRSSEMIKHIHRIIPEAGLVELESGGVSLYSAKYELLCEVFGRKLTRAVDYNALTIDDLYYVGV